MQKIKRKSLYINKFLVSVYDDKDLIPGSGYLSITTQTITSNLN